MSTITPSDDKLITFDDPYVGLAMSMLQNAVEEIRYYIKQTTKRRRTIASFGYIKNPLAELRWFITNPNGAELLAVESNLDHIIHQ